MHYEGIRYYKYMWTQFSELRGIRGHSSENGKHKIFNRSIELDSFKKQDKPLFVAHPLQISTIKSITNLQFS
jgi:hypothetical protein